MTLIHKSLAGISLLLAMLACTLPFEQVPPPNDVQTAAALPLQTIVTASFTSTVMPSRTAETPTTISSPTGTTTLTPTYSLPMLTVQEPTNCRTGPGEDYDVLFTYLAGKKLEIVGRYDPGNFWLVKSPESPGGTCWLWGDFVEVTGSYWAVSSVTPPPTATPPPPQRPVLENWEFSCSGDILTITILWFDRADNETGYRVFRNGEAVAELPANSNMYTESTELPAGQWAEYYIQAYNPVGSANTSIMRMTCG